MGSITLLKKALLYKGKHRGSKEFDLILGGFVDRVIHTLSEDELFQLQSLLAQDDAQITAQLQEPQDQDLVMIRKLRSYLENMLDPNANNGDPLPAKGKL